MRQSRHQSLTVESALASPTPSTPFSTTTPATPSLYPSAPSRSTMDPRDSASTRENMTALLAASGASVGGPVVGLAGMFGGSAKPPPLHRVNSTFTELEQAEMEKLEVEMASKRKHYGDVEVEVPPPRAAGGLAALMQAKSAGDSAVGERVARRWGPPEPVKAASAPTPLAASSSPAPASYDFSSAKAGSYGSNSFPSTTTTSTTTTPRPTPAAAVSFPSYGNQGPSPLAAAMGSKASGPRLNQPAPTPVADEGPAHARSRGGGGAVAMPGMVAAGTVRERTRSFTNSSVPSPVVEASRPAPKQLDSVEGGVRERRTSFPSAAIPAPKRVESVEAKIVSRSPPKDEEVFKRPSSPTKFAGGGAFTSEPASISMNKNGPTPSLTRLQSSSIVSERLKSSQLWEQEEASIPEVTTKPGAVKRRSVLERWGRDSPDSSTSAGAPPASKVEREADVKLVGGFGAEGGKGLAVGSEGPALIQVSVGSCEEEIMALTSREVVQLNRDRARPPKSTPRSLPVQHDQPMHEPAELPASYSDAPLPPLDSSTTRSDPSPRFDSPVADSNWGETLPMSREPSALDITPQAWTGPPIGVKEVAKPTSSFTRDDEAPPVKHSRGVALPGMSAPPPDPTMSRLIASQYETSRGIQEIKISPRYVEADRPSAMDVASSISQATAPPPISIPAETNPWSRPTPNATTTSPDRPSPSFVAPATPQPRVRPASVFTTAKIIWRAEVDDDVPPPSPSVSVRDAAALWGAPARSTPAASIAIKESYGVKVSSRPASVDFSARPAPSAARRQPSVDFGALRAAYASPAPTPASEPPRLSRQPSKPQLASSPSSSSSPIELFAVRSSSLVPIKPGRTFSHDVLVVVDRTAPVSGTKVWVWTGVEAALDEAILEQLKKEHRTTPSVVSQRRESPELVNRLGSPLIICKVRFATCSTRASAHYYFSGNSRLVRRARLEAVPRGSARRHRRPRRAPPRELMIITVPLRDSNGFYFRPFSGQLLYALDTASSSLPSATSLFGTARGARLPNGAPQKVLHEGWL